MSIPTRCPLCSASLAEPTVVTHHVYGGSANQAFYKCHACDVIYLHPGLDAEQEAKFYAAEFEKFMSDRAGSQGGWEQPERHILLNEKQRLRRMKYLGKHIQKKASILEVGCSSGFMLYPLIENGHKCTGIEPSGVFSDYVSSRGIQCFDSIDALKNSVGDDKQFDIIMHYFVLEHVPDPLQFLSEQFKLLRPNGKLIFEIPNASDALYSVYDIPEFEHFYWSVAHHWYFTESSLEYLLDKTGLPYEILLDQRYDLSNHMVWARDGKPGGMDRFTEILGEDIENQYRQALILAHKCDTLVGVITKE